MRHDWIRTKNLIQSMGNNVRGITRRLLINHTEPGPSVPASKFGLWNGLLVFDGG
jgi:hypothetical protein